MRTVPVRLLRVVVPMVVAVLVAGCGPAPETPPRARSAAPDAGAVSSAAAPSVTPDPVEVRGSPTLARIRERGTLLVGLRTGAPAFARRGENGHAGFDVRIARILAEGLGLDPRRQVAFRRLPPTLRVDAVVGGSVDVQLGGFDPSTGRVASVGPYVLVGSPGSGHPEFVGIRPGDEVFRSELRGILVEALSAGRWERAAEAAFSGTGVRVRPPDLSR